MFIPYGRQDISDADVEAVVKVLRSDFLTQGSAVPHFEQEIANYCGGQFGVAVNSATSALHIACLSLGLGPGDWLWTSPNTFVSSANCALYCGAKVDFVDIDLETHNLCPHRLEEKLIRAEKRGNLPKIVIPVHFAGQPCEMKSIYSLSKKYGFRIIEDASHAIGASFHDHRIGSGIFSDVTVFSFHPVKIITTGEGGMAITNNEYLANEMRRLRTHGITNDSQSMHCRPNEEIWNYQQVALGFNYRMTDIQAALGLSQLDRINNFLEIRREIARCYDDALSGLPLQLPVQNTYSSSAYHLYPVTLLTGNSGKSQKFVYQEMKKRGIQVNLHYIPVYLQPFFEERGFARGYCPNAESYFVSALSLPIFPALKSVEQDEVICSLKEILHS